MRFGRVKTSDFSSINIRTFRAKHRNFVSKKSDVSAFPVENAGNNPFSPILQYFGAVMPSVASVALLGALTTVVGSKNKL